MDQKTPLPKVAILGGTSKVWCLAKHHWSLCSYGVCQTYVVGRRAARGIDVLLHDVDKLPQCDAVISMWGVTQGDEKTLSQNAELARSAQKIAHILGADRCLHLSSGAVYAPSDVALGETALTQPFNVYGQSKLAAEQAVCDGAMRSVNLRLGNVAGADALARAIGGSGPLILDQFDDGTTPARSYIAPDDLAHVLLRLVMMEVDPLPDVINVAGSEPVEMGQIAKAAGKTPLYRPAPEGALRLHHLLTSRLRSLGMNAQRSSDPAHLASFDYPDKAER